MVGTFVLLLKLLQQHCYHLCFLWGPGRDVFSLGKLGDK